MARPDVAAFLLGLDGAIMSWGAGAEALLGFTAEELLGRRVSLLVPPEQTSGFSRILHVVAQGQRIETVQTLACKDGTRMEVSLVVSPARNGGGRITGARAIAQDVTDEMAEEARGRFTALLESIPDAVYMLDRRGLIRTWNPGAERLYGYAAHEAIGLAGLSLTPGHWHEEANLALECVLAGEPVQLFETEARRKDSVLIPISLNLWPIRDRQGEVRGVSVIARDLTEEHLILAALAESEVRLRESESLAQVGGWVWDVGTGAVQWSEQLHRIHGLDPARFAGTLEAHLEPIVPEDRDRVRSAMAEAVTVSRPFETDYRIRRSDGATRILHGRAEVALGPADTVAVAGLRGIAQDITDRRHAHSDLQARLGGELRSALGTILDAGRLLAQSDLEPEDAQHASDVVDVARRLLALVDPSGVPQAAGASGIEAPPDRRRS